MKQRKDGYYSSSVYLGKDENGKRKYKTVCCKTQKEVKAKIAQLKVQLGKGIDVAAASDSFGSWGVRFLAAKQSSGISEGQLRNLRVYIDHLAPLAPLPAVKVNSGMIQDIIDSKADKHLDKNGRIVAPLAKRTLTGIKSTARGVFGTIIQARVMDYNPADVVVIPKEAVQTKRKAITEAQQQWIREMPHRAQRAAMIMLYSGLRRGELTCLTWGDIDFTNKTISVNKAVTFDKTGKPVLKSTSAVVTQRRYAGRVSVQTSTKTPAGYRTIEVQDILIDFLRAEKATDDCLYVIHNRDGKMLTDTAWRRMWNSYMADFNMKYGLTPEAKKLLGWENKNVSKFQPGGVPMLIDVFDRHQLRHTFATNCYLNGIDAQTCMEWMGHTKLSTTQEIYTHISKELKRVRRDRLEQIAKWEARDKAEKEAEENNAAEEAQIKMA